MPSFQPFSSGGQSSHLQTPETTPLRKRENDSFASPEAPLLWRQPLQPATGALHNRNNYSPSLAASSSHFAELNFPNMTRRRGRHDNRPDAQVWIRWAMKAILASPLVILMLWFVAVALHHPTESSTMKNNRYGIAAAKNPHNLQQKQQQSILQQRASHKDPGKHHIPVYVPMGSSDQQQQQQQQQQLLSPGMQLQQANGLQNPQYLIPQSEAQKSFMMKASPSGGQVPNGFMLEQPQMMQQPGQMMQQGQPQMIMPGQNMMQLTTQQQPEQMFQQQPQQQPFMMQQAQPQMTRGQPQFMSQNQLQIPLQMQQPLQSMEQAEHQPLLMASRGNHKQNQRPAHPSHWGNLRGGRQLPAKGSKQTAATDQLPKIYYYDPAQAMAQGQLQAPSVVYDEHGNEVELTALVASSTDLFIEPPISELMASPAYGSSQSNTANRRLKISSNSTGTNSTEPLLPPPPLAMNMNIKRPESWGESTTQDQSIIICTVATMALLVGAVSARRVRARSWFSSCIENESLEDEVAFDNAYTITGGDSYNTFGWKGDLEKFDV